MENVLGPHFVPRASSLKITILNVLTVVVPVFVLKLLYFFHKKIQTSFLGMRYRAKDFILSCLLSLFYFYLGPDPKQKPPLWDNEPTHVVFLSVHALGKACCPSQASQCRWCSDSSVTEVSLDTVRTIAHVCTAANTGPGLQG